MSRIYITNGEKLSVGDHELPIRRVDWVSRGLAISGTTIHTFTVSDITANRTKTYETDVVPVAALQIARLLFAHNGVIYEIDRDNGEISEVIEYDILSRGSASFISVHNDVVTKVKSNGVQEVGRINDFYNLELEGYHAIHTESAATGLCNIMLWREEDVVLIGLGGDRPQTMKRLTLPYPVVQATSLLNMPPNFVVLTQDGELREITAKGEVRVIKSNIFCLINDGSYYRAIGDDGTMFQIQDSSYAHRVDGRLEDLSYLYVGAYGHINPEAKSSRLRIKSAVY